MVEVVLLGDGAVDVPCHRVDSPLEGVDMKIGRQINANAVISGGGVNVIGPWGAMMQSSGCRPSVLALGFHDVDLARCSPSSVCGIVGKHPDGGPEKCSVWELGSGLESTMQP